ncbi:MAG: nucleotide exchange factor GrpE [Blastocatellia bacterium]
MSHTDPIDHPEQEALALPDAEEVEEVEEEDILDLSPADEVPRPPEPPYTLYDPMRQLRMRRFAMSAVLGDSREDTSAPSGTTSSDSEREAYFAAIKEASAPRDEPAPAPDLEITSPQAETTEPETEIAAPQAETPAPAADIMGFLPEAPAPEADIAALLADMTAPEEDSLPHDPAAERREAIVEASVREASGLLEQTAAAATEQTKEVLAQVANNAVLQIRRVLERMAAEAGEETQRMLRQLSGAALDQTTETLRSLVRENQPPELGTAVSDLSGEVRRVGRELYKSTRAAERGQDMFETTLAELRQLTQRVERVPAQLHGAESIFDVRAGICRDLLGMADALDVSQAAARETLDQLEDKAYRIDNETESEAADDLEQDTGDTPPDVAAELNVEPETSDDAADSATRVIPMDSVAKGTFLQRALWRIAGQPPTPVPAPRPDDDRERRALHAALRQARAEAQNARRETAALANRLTRQENLLERETARRASRETALRDALAETLQSMGQWLHGQELLRDRMENTLDAIGARRIGTEGERFDPSRHRAVSTEIDNEVEPGTIIGEERAGYLLDGKILRYAEVIVSRHE